MSGFEERIGYSFNNPEFIRTALTHSSYANENRSKKLQSNERLEFLGDSALGLICAQYIFLKYPELPEGELTKIRASVVCEASLHELSCGLGIDGELLLGRGEEQGGGRRRPSILANAFEAVLAAVYLDGGMKAANEFALRHIAHKVELAVKGRAAKDYKTLLQEIVQKNHEEVLSYRLKSETGPDHDKTFTVELLLNSNVIAEGVGKSKKDAEQKAAGQALELMGQ